MQKWEWQLKGQKQAKQQEQGSGSSPRNSGFQALKAWSRIPRSTRDALKRSAPGAVEVLELPILEFLDQVPISTIFANAHGRMAHVSHGQCGIYGFSFALFRTGNSGTLPVTASQGGCASSDHVSKWVLYLGQQLHGG